MAEAPTVVTLRERKARKTARNIAAAAAVKEALRDFVRKSGNAGRFIVFGSAATGTMRYDSDFDVIVDFPVEREADAWNAVEDACERWDIKADVFSTATTSDEFLAQIMQRAVEIVE